MITRQRFTEEELARQTEFALVDPSLDVTAVDVEFCRKMVAEYEAKVAEYKAKAEAAPSRKRGAYKSHEVQTLKARDSMAENLGFQLEWLRRWRPEIYDEVMEQK